MKGLTQKTVNGPESAPFAMKDKQLFLPEPAPDDGGNVNCMLNTFEVFDGHCFIPVQCNDPAKAGNVFGSDFNFMGPLHPAGFFQVHEPVDFHAVLKVEPAGLILQLSAEEGGRFMRGSAMGICKMFGFFNLCDEIGREETFHAIL